MSHISTSQQFQCYILLSLGWCVTTTQQFKSPCYVLKSYISGGTSGSSTNPSEQLLWAVLAGGFILDASSGPALVFWRGTMLARSMAECLLGSTSSLSGIFVFLYSQNIREWSKSEAATLSLLWMCLTRNNKRDHICKSGEFRLCHCIYKYTKTTSRTN